MKDQAKAPRSDGNSGIQEGENPIPDSHSRHPNAREYLFDRPRNVRLLLWSFYASLLILLIIEFFIHKHPYFPWEGWSEFYAVYGFVACVVLVVAAKYILRPLMKRREDYYD